VTISTRTTQPISRASVENAANKDTTEAEEKTRDILAVCDSLHKLHETLARLDYAVKRKKIEKSLTEKSLFAPENSSPKKPDFKQCVILVVLAAVAITVFSLLFLNFTFSETVIKNNKLLNTIADEQALYWHSFLERRLTQVHDIAFILESYGREPSEIRRQRSDSTLENFTSRDDEIVTLYAAWKPDAVDGIGQDIAESFGESEKIEIMPAINTGRRDAYLVTMTAPILDSLTNEVVGIAGCAYDLDELQKTLEKLIAGNSLISAMEIQTNDGFIIASYVSDRIGKNLSNLEPLNNSARMAVKPFTIGNVTWLVMVGATEELILLGKNESIRFTIIVALMAIVTASAAIFIVFSIMNKPINQGNYGGMKTPKKYFTKEF